MDNKEYFYGMVEPEEMKGMEYIPTIPQFLDFIEDRYANLPAISDLETTKTYAELVSDVKKRVAYINSLNLPAGSNIAVMCRNDLDAMELFLAIPASGHVVLMLPNALNDQALTGISMKFQLSAMFVAEEFKGLTGGVKCPTYDTKAMADTEADYADVNKDTEGFIFFTGGTTGAPKGALHTHGSFLRGCFNGIFKPGHILHKKVIAMLPLSHIFGAVMGFMSQLYTGSTVYACADMRAAIGQIPVIRPTMLVLVPGLVEIIINIAKMKGKEFLGDLESIMCGAAPVPPRLMKECEDFGILMCAGYGLTETANLDTANVYCKNKPASMGRVYPEQEAKVVNGELWIKGDNLMKGYYNELEKTAEVMEDGYLKTGDLVEFDEDGDIYITGRIKNVIILPNGENVSPEEIEELFYKQSLVKDCLVEEMELNGNQVIGVQIIPYMPELEGLSPEEIQTKVQEQVDAVNETLPAFKRVLKLVIRTEDFKRSGAMKILRNQD